MEELVELSKIFSDISRVRIIALILREGRACVCELCDTLELSQPLVSRSLKKMRELGILEAKQKGKWVIYSLNTTQKPYVFCLLEELKKAETALPPLKACQAL